MSEKPRFLFDENIGLAAMLQIQQVSLSECHFQHITEFSRQGVKDSEWTRMIAQEPGWVVITGDGGKNSKKEERLPLLCAQYGITHVVFSPTLQVKSRADKVAALLHFWAEIEQQTAETPGIRFDLRYREVRGTRSLVRLSFERSAPTTQPKKSTLPKQINEPPAEPPSPP